MPRMQIFGMGQKADSAFLTSQRRVNYYAEFNQQGDRGPISFHQRPGLELFATLGDKPARGMYAVDDTLYVVNEDTFFTVNNAGVRASKGTMNTTSGNVGMSYNGSEVIVVDGTDGWIYNISADTFTQITDGDFVACNTVAFQAGRFIVNKVGTGQFYISGSYDGTTWDGTEFATAEGFSDDLRAVFVDHNEVLLLGSFSTEVWTNVGATDFPYQRVSGAAIEWGLAARWSIQKVDSTAMWLGQNRLGDVQAVRLAGYVPTPVSNPEVEYLWNNYSAVSDATALTYRIAGHSFYQLNFPSAGKSWLMDVQTGAWSELESGTKGMRHRGEFSEYFINRTIVSDYDNGKLYTLSHDALDDNGTNFAKELVSRHIFDEEEISIGRLWVDMEAGVGSLTSEPQMMLQISKDGGHSYGPEKWVGFGKEGEYKDRALWRRLGRAKDWTFRLRCSDPVRITVTGAWVDSI